MSIDLVYRSGFCFGFCNLDKRASHPNWIDKGFKSVQLLEPLTETGKVPDGDTTVMPSVAQLPKSLFPLLTNSDTRKILTLAALLAELRSMLLDCLNIHKLYLLMIISISILRMRVLFVDILGNTSC